MNTELMNTEFLLQVVTPAIWALSAVYAVLRWGVSVARGQEPRGIILAAWLQTFGRMMFLLAGYWLVLGDVDTAVITVIVFYAVYVMFFTFGVLALLALVGARDTDYRIYYEWLPNSWLAANVRYAIRQEMRAPRRHS